MATPEQSENRAKWVAALRSGDYTQGKGLMRQQQHRGDAFCCLGVLYEVCGISSTWRSNYGGYEYEDGSASMPAYETFTQLTGIDAMYTDNDGVVVDVPECLASMNDSGEYTFSEIADTIDSEDWY